MQACTAKEDWFCYGVEKCGAVRPIYWVVTGALDICSSHNTLCCYFGGLAWITLQFVSVLRFL